MSTLSSLVHCLRDAVAPCACEIAISVAFAAAIVPTTASAQAPGYVGTWADRPAQCRLDQSSENAPIVMRRDGYDQHETHCKFTSVRAQNPAWAIKAQCMVEGDTQSIDLLLSVAGNRLTIRDEAGARTLERCR
jgi:hypothetical protein